MQRVDVEPLSGIELTGNPICPTASPALEPLQRAPPTSFNRPSTRLVGNEKRTVRTLVPLVLGLTALLTVGCNPSDSPKPSPELEASGVANSSSTLDGSIGAERVLTRHRHLGFSPPTKYYESAIDHAARMAISAEHASILEDPDSAKAKIHLIEQRLGIKIDLITWPVYVLLQRVALEADPPELADWISYAHILSTELERYPAQIFARCGVKRIVLCANLQISGQARTGTANFDHLDLYFDVARGRHDRQYVRRVIHHEIFHLIDYTDDGSVYEDPNWSALNLPDFGYGQGGARSQEDGRSSLLDNSLTGFLNKYSMSGVEEDKAELFGFMLVAPDVVNSQVALDHVLARKVTAMRDLLARFCPDADEKIWRRQ